MLQYLIGFYLLCVCNSFSNPLYLQSKFKTFSNISKQNKTQNDSAMIPKEQLPKNPTIWTPGNIQN